MKGRVIAPPSSGLLHYKGHLVKGGHCVTCAMQREYVKQLVRDAVKALSDENLRLRADLAELTNTDERRGK